MRHDQRHDRDVAEVARPRRITTHVTRRRRTRSRTAPRARPRAPPRPEQRDERDQHERPEAERREARARSAPGAERGAEAQPARLARDPGCPRRHRRRRCHGGQAQSSQITAVRVGELVRGQHEEADWQRNSSGRGARSCRAVARSSPSRLVLLERRLRRPRGWRGGALLQQRRRAAPRRRRGAAPRRGRRHRRRPLPRRCAAVGRCRRSTTGTGTSAARRRRSRRRAGRRRRRLSRSSSSSSSRSSSSRSSSSISGSSSSNSSSLIGAPSATVDRIGWGRGARNITPHLGQVASQTSFRDADAIPGVTAARHGSRGAAPAARMPRTEVGAQETVGATGWPDCPCRPGYRSVLYLVS